MLGLQQSGVPLVLQLSDLNSYPKGDFYPVFHTLLQHKCLLLEALQVTYKEGIGLLRLPLYSALGRI